VSAASLNNEHSLHFLSEHAAAIISEHTSEHTLCTTGSRSRASSKGTGGQGLLCSRACIQALTSLHCFVVVSGTCAQRGGRNRSPMQAQLLLSCRVRLKRLLLALSNKAGVVLASLRTLSQDDCMQAGYSQG
jgi:hypothetical protein